MRIYFTDFFEVTSETLEQYGAFNISLVNDLPLFVDPFLLFNSKKRKYRELHDKIIQYVAFLRDSSKESKINVGLLKSWFCFPEIRQNWLGYSKTGNHGSGLGFKFAKALNENLHTVFNNFGNEEISNGSHLEKLCLIKEGVGRDNISDFTTNLIKGFLLEYTETFTRAHINPKYSAKHIIDHVEFNYKTRTWEQREFLLPTLGKNYVLLTPKEILTKDDAWINKSDMVDIPQRQITYTINME